ILWYWARPNGVIVDPMAGSGMLWHVYEDRARWGVGRDDLEFSIGMFDLNPRGPYANRIGQHDLLTRFPRGVRPDTVILDRARPSTPAPAPPAMARRPVCGRPGGPGHPDPAALVRGGGFPRPPLCRRPGSGRHLRGPVPGGDQPATREGAPLVGLGYRDAAV